MAPSSKPTTIDKRINMMDDGIGARKRVFIPGYSGVISRLNETIGGTFSDGSRHAHYLVYRGCVPAMQKATLPSPDEFYSRFAACCTHSVLRTHGHLIPRGGGAATVGVP